MHLLATLCNAFSVLFIYIFAKRLQTPFFSPVNGARHIFFFPNLRLSCIGLQRNATFAALCYHISANSPLTGFPIRYCHERSHELHYRFIAKRCLAPFRLRLARRVARRIDLLISMDAEMVPFVDVTFSASSYRLIAKRCLAPFRLPNGAWHLFGFELSTYCQTVPGTFSASLFGFTFSACSCVHVALPRPRFIARVGKTCRSLIKP